MKFNSFTKRAFLALTMSFLLTFSALAEVREVIAEGEAAIISSKDVAEQSAIASALRNAVEQTSGLYLLSETKTKNFQVITDEIYTKAQGYVSSREILSKKEVNGNIVVKIKAQVSMEPLLESMKKLGLLRKWTVAVISEKNYDNAKYVESATNSINQVVIDNGFRVVDNDVLSSLEKPETMNQILKGNYLAASQMLRDNGVDVLVICKTITESLSGNNFNAYGIDVNIQSAKGRIDAKLVRADTGELLGVKSFEKISVGSGDGTKAQALKDAGVEAGHFFVNQIIKLPASTSAYVQLYIKGLSFAKIKPLIDEIKAIRGVRKVTNKIFKNKEAIFEIETEGDSNLLASNISENTDLLKKFKFDITSVTSGKIEAVCE